MPADLSARVRGGARTPEDPIQMLGDTIREIDTDCETVREWRIWEKLDVEDEVICPLEGRREWTHANSISLTKEGDFLLSFRHTSNVVIVSRETGDITWRWGAGEGQPPTPRDAARRRQHPDIRQRVALVRQEQLPRNRG